MTRYIIFLSLLFALGYFMTRDYEQAMAQCQIQHSFDTCFHSLNR